MKAIWLLGDAGSSELVDASVTPNVSVWPDQVSIALGSYHAMSLNAGGNGPGPVPAVALTVKGFVRNYINNLQTTIEADLNASTGWQVVPKPLDWRLSIDAIASTLALQINALPADQIPVTLVGHGMGGLLARAIWRVVNLAGQSARIRRIITIGTPQWGCYPTCNTLLGKDGWQQSILASPSQNWLLYNPAPTGNVQSPYSQQVMAKVAATWPSTYELLPFVNTPGTTDPVLPDLYSGQSWPVGYGVSQTWLDYAKNVFQPRLLDASSIPPAQVMTCYIAMGDPTWSSLLPLSVPGLRRFPSPMTTADGDGRVLEVGQSTLGSRKLTLIGSHSTLLDHTAVLSSIVAEILEPRTVPDPPAFTFLPPVYKGIDPTFPLPPIATIPQTPMPTPQGICPGGKCVC